MLQVNISNTIFIFSINIYFHVNFSILFLFLDPCFFCSNSREN